MAEEYLDVQLTESQFVRLRALLDNGITEVRTGGDIEARADGGKLSLVNKRKRREVLHEGDGGDSGGIFLVYLTWSGDGADGDGTTAATWTYHVFEDAGRTEQIGTALAPVAARVLPAENTPAAVGLAEYGGEDGEELILVHAFEAYPMDECTSPSPSPTP